MKSNIQKLLSICIAASTFLTGCEEVVDVKLKSAEPRVVIEGFVSDRDTNHVVRISRTIPFTDSDKFDGVAGASVVLITGTGQTVEFFAAGNGIYKSSRFAGTPGSKYKLRVTLGGQVYTASCTMPLAVKLDSISFKKISFFGNENIFPVAHYKDPKEVSNQYLFFVKFKDKQPQILAEDRFTNGNNVTETLFFDSDDVETGDSLQVEMLGIDRTVYRYFFSIAQISGEGGPPVAPANPDSNFDNGALGVFNAYTTSKVTRVVNVK